VPNRLSFGDGFTQPGRGAPFLLQQITEQMVATTEFASRSRFSALFLDQPARLCLLSGRYEHERSDENVSTSALPIPFTTTLAIHKHLFLKKLS
jgi:hypothetical protein